MKNKKNKSIKIDLKKFVRGIFIIIIFTGIITFLATKSIYSYKIVDEKKVYINSGDTLWTIAKHEQKYNEYYKGTEIREIIYDIRKLNNMSNANLIPGKIIKVYYK